MQKIGSVTYWFCSGAALFLAVVGVWNVLEEGHPISILLFCFGAAAAFYVAGLWVRWMARRAARLECDEDKAQFEAKLGKLAKAKPAGKS